MAGFNNYRHDLKIGIGEKNHFYTLREAYPHYIPGPGDFGNAVVNGVYQGSIEIRYAHLQNLSQDPAEAIAKAKEIAAARGVPLQPVTVEDLQGQLDEIKRATAEQLAERERVIQRQREEWEAQQEEREVMLRDMIDQGVCPIGKHAGADIADIDRGYATWLLEKREEFVEGSLMRALADKVAADYAHLRLPVPDPDKKIGEPKQRLEFEATVVRVHGFYTDFGYTGLTTLVTDDGTCLLVKGSWRVVFVGDRYDGKHVVDARPGERVKFKATVKEHREYRGQMQTVVQRVKEAA